MTDIASDSLESVSSPFEIEERLRAMHQSCAQSPQIVELVAENGNTLAIGVGNEKSYLNFVKEGGWPAYSSLGDDKAEGTLAYSMNGYFTELPAKYGITFDLAVQTAKAFFDTGNLPDTVAWEEN